MKVCSQGSLSYILVTAPVIKVDNPYTCEVRSKAGKSKVFIYFILGRISSWPRNDYFKMFGSIFHQGGKSGNSISSYTKLFTYNSQSDIGSYQSTDNQNRYLYHVCISHHFHTSQ